MGHEQISTALDRYTTSLATTLTCASARSSPASPLTIC
jgi:hypothetical protein